LNADITSPQEVSTLPCPKNMENKLKSKRGPRGGFSLLELVIVMAIVLVIAGLAIPKVVTIAQNLRTGGDARDLNGAILVAKMRASSDYAQARLHVDLSTQTFWIEVEPSGSTTWTTEGGTQYLSTNVTFGYGSLTSPPSGTQSTLGQATACTGFSNSACIIFNSRGIPVDTTNTPYGNYAIYVTDGKSVSGVTVSITGVTHIWRTDASSANWIKR
jgi:prepilin-type N-terminal cleavage/methylation domain-containing protein